MKQFKKGVVSAFWFVLMAGNLFADASVTTDQTDYSPGSTVQIIGSGFAAGEMVQLQVLNLTDPSDNGPEHDPWTVAADTNGNFQSTWYVTPDELDSTLQLTATGLTSGLTATAIFTDAGGGTWTGTLSTEWSLGGNWSGGSPPGSSDNCTIQAAPSGGRFPTVDTASGSAICKSLVVKSGATVTISGGSLTLGSDFTLDGTISQTGGTLIQTGNGNWQNAPGGVYNASGGTVEFNTTGSHIGTGLTLNFFNLLSDSGDSTLFDANANTYNIAGSWTNNGSPTFTAQATTVIFSGTGGQNIAGSSNTAFANVTIANASSKVSVNTGFTVATSRACVVKSNADLEIGTNVIGGAGAFTNSTGGTLGIGSPAGITSSGATGNVQVTGTRAFSSGGIYVYDGSAAQVTGNGLPTPVNQVTVTNSANVTLSQSTTITNLNLGAGNFTNASLTMANGGTITRFAGALTVAPTFGASVNVIYTGNTGVTTGNELPVATTVVSNLTLGYNSASTATLNAARTVNGVLTIGANSTLADGGNTLTAKGNVSNSGLHNGTGEILLAGSSSQTLSGSGSYGNLELGNSSGVVLGANLTVNGLLNIDSSSKLNLAFPGTAASLAINGVSKASGTWGSTSSSAAHTDNTHFSGTNVLTVTSGSSSSTAVSSSANPSAYGQTVTFTATITGSGPTPTGTVQFLTNGVSAGTVLLTSGAASLTLSNLPHATNLVTAQYAGDSHFNGSTNSLSEIINTPPSAGIANYSRPQNVTLIITITNLLTNAFDADGDAITLSGVSAHSTNNANVFITGHYIVYQPPATNGNVTDTFNYFVSDSFGATNTGLAVVTIQGSPTAQSLNIISITLTNGTALIKFAGIPGYKYLVQASTNLPPTASWVTLGTNFAGTNGLFQFLDAQASNYPMRYYRTSSQ